MKRKREDDDAGQRKFKEYKILQSYRWPENSNEINRDKVVLSNFEKKVEAHLRDGWVLQGEEYKREIIINTIKQWQGKTPPKLVDEIYS